MIRLEFMFSTVVLSQPCILDQNQYKRAKNYENITKKLRKYINKHGALEILFLERMKLKKLFRMDDLTKTY